MAATENRDHTASLAASSLEALQVRSGKSVGILLAAILLGIASGGGSTWLVMQHANASDPAASTDQPANISESIVPLDSFTVNLADPEETHFLRLTIDLGIARPSAGSEKEKDPNGFPKARVRDSILSVLTNCKANPLLTSEGKQQLKQNLVEALNHSVPELNVRQIYFTEFLVQR